MVAVAVIVVGTAVWISKSRKSELMVSPSDSEGEMATLA